MAIPDYIWRKAERNQVARERERLLANGTIRPRESGEGLPPTTFERRPDGSFKQCLGFYNPLKIYNG